MANYRGLRTYQNYPSADYPNKHAWISSRLLTLRHDLNEVIERDRQPNSLIIGSWNIRAFDGGMPRLDESYHYIAEIIDHFDICAIQEVKSDLFPLERLVRLLGRNWDYFVSDVSTHQGGNSERMAFVYNKSRVYFQNLIGEIVLPREDLVAGEQIARTPFFASFQAGWFRFSLCSVHIIFGDDLSLRAEEISTVAEALITRARREDQVHIFLGDMNIEEQDDETMQALLDSGLEVPDFGPTNMAGNRYFDQMAFTERGQATRKTKLLRHGVFDWRHAVFGPHPSEDAPPISERDIENGVSRLTLQENLDHYGPIVERRRAEYDRPPYANWPGMYRRWSNDEMSDHLPIWMELEIDYSDDYLRQYLD